MSTSITKKQRQAESLESILQLQDWLQDGQTIYTILRSVSSNGMQRSISCIYFENNEPRHISYHVARATESRLSMKKGYNAVSIRGCGMDMGFHLVRCLSSAIGKKLRHEWL